jgi:hypothetical protein
MPWVEVFSLLGSPVNFDRAAKLSLAAINAKPGHLKGASVAAWSGQGRSGLDAAMAETCQVKDLVPAKDQTVILTAREGDLRIDELAPERLFEIMVGIVDMNPVPPGLLVNEFTRALGDFLVPESGVLPMRTLKAQTAWMRGLMPSTLGYQPCVVCGFPAFFEKDVAETGGKPERGWFTGSLLGAGWQPGTPSTGTVDISVCIPCRAEKIITEDGLRIYGRHPIRLFNLGQSPIAQEDVFRAYNETWGFSISAEDDGSSSAIPAGGSGPFGDVGDQEAKVGGAISFATLRFKLTYAYLYLRSRGYDVALDLPGALHPQGVFGWVPEPCRPGATFLRQRVSKLAMQGYASNPRTPFERKKARVRSILTSPGSQLVLTLMEAVREMLKKPQLIRPITDIFTINGGKPMRFANLNLLDEAVAWSEAAYPILSNNRTIWNEGGATKAMSEAMDQMMRTVSEERVGVAMAAITRNINKYLKAEEAAKVPAVMADLQVRLGKYALLSQSELSALRNQLDPLIRAAVRNGVRYTPEQNNFCRRWKRRLNDPVDVVADFEEPIPETEPETV